MDESDPGGARGPNEHPTMKAFDFRGWIERHRHLLEPPVGNRQLFDERTDMVVMIVGGPNRRVDFHDDPVGEFFYQIEGDMILKIADEHGVRDVPIREGEVFYLPPHVRHSPQRPQAGSVGLVVEGTRRPGDEDGFEWFCMNCHAKLHRAQLEVRDIVKDLPPVFEAFYADTDKRTCRRCGAVHPGREPPPGWAEI